NGGDPGSERLSLHLSSRLPEYMMPAAVMRLESLPLTPNGKVDRKALPAPDWGRAEQYEALRTPVEEILAGIWADLLKVERVGRQDNFFSLGGHSLLAMQMISRIREIVGLDASLASIFAAPVLSEFASKLEGLTTEGQAPPPIASWKRGARLPLSFGQQRLWFINRLEPGSSSYNVPAALRLTGRLEIRALAGSFAEIVQRHEVLRTVFVLQD